MNLKNLFIIYEFTNIGLFFSLLIYINRLFKQIGNNPPFEAKDYEYLSAILTSFAFHLMDNYIFMKFYLQNIFSAALQVKVIKLISSGIFIYIAIESMLYIEVILFLSFELLGAIIVTKMENKKVDDSYHQYNIRVGLDSRNIQELLLTETIDYCKLLYVISSLSSFFVNLYVSKFKNSDYSVTRVCLFLLDYLLNYTCTEKIIYYILSSFLYYIIFIYTIINAIKISKSSVFHKNLSFLINIALLILIIALLSSYLIFKRINKSHKI